METGTLVGGHSLVSTEMFSKAPLLILDLQQLFSRQSEDMDSSPVDIDFLGQSRLQLPLL